MSLDSLTISQLIFLGKLFCRDTFWVWRQHHSCSTSRSGVSSHLRTWVLQFHSDHKQCGEPFVYTSVGHGMCVNEISKYILDYCFVIRFLITYTLDFYPCKSLEEQVRTQLICNLIALIYRWFWYWYRTSQVLHGRAVLNLDGFGRILRGFPNAHRRHVIFQEICRLRYAEGQRISWREIKGLDKVVSPDDLSCFVLVLRPSTNRQYKTAVLGSWLEFWQMPSYNAVWIPTVAVAYTLALALLIYAWEHMYGSVSRCLRRSNSQNDTENVKKRFPSGVPVAGERNRKNTQIDQVKALL